MLREQINRRAERLTKETMIQGYVYILECSNGQCYTGSTKDLDSRLAQH